MVRVLALSAAAVAIVLATAAAAPPPPAERIESQILQTANGFRADHGLPPLRSNAVLEADARAFAEYMARTGRFSHTADGRDPAQRARAAGYDYCTLEENIAYEEDDAGYGPDRLARIFMSNWEASPGHRRNLLGAEVMETGVGVVQAPSRGAMQRFIAVQEFGRPLSMRYSFEIENRTDARIPFTFDGADGRLAPHSTMRETTCATGDIIMPSLGRDRSRYAAEPGARYVLTNSAGETQVEVVRPGPPGGRPED
jgi:uncharacterized protein YkwD